MNSDQLSASSSQDSETRSTSQDEQTRQYVEEFRREVELKFAASKANRTYKFPRKSVNRPRKSGSHDSCDSLEGVTFYDLESQNVRRQLVGGTKFARGSESDALVEIVTSLGKLDPRYLRSQFSTSRSTLFRILQKSVERKHLADRHSIDTKHITPCEYEVGSNDETIKDIQKRCLPLSSDNKEIYESKISSRRLAKPPTQRLVNSRTMNSSVSKISHNTSNHSCSSRTGKRRPEANCSIKRETSSNILSSQAPSLLAAMKKNLVKSHTNLLSATSKPPQPATQKSQALKPLFSIEAKKNFSGKRSAETKIPLRGPSRDPKPGIHFRGIGVSVAEPSARKETFKSFVASKKNIKFP